MKAHKEYREVDIPGLYKIPKTWIDGKFKYNVYYQEGPGLRHWQFMDKGVKVICVTNITENGIDFSSYTKYISKEEYESSYKHFTVKRGNLLIASSGASWGKIAEYDSNEIVILNTSTIRLETSKRILNSFLKYLLESQYIQDQLSILITGSCQPNFGPTHLSKLDICLPSDVEEQRQIAVYLDYKTNQIDRFITNRKKQIELLEERKAKTIERAILRGINKGVTLKDSGFDWIGQIPNHWEIWKLKFLARITTGNKDTVDREDDGQYPFYVRSDNVERISTYSFDGEAILTAGDGVGVAKVFHYANGKFDFHQRVYCIYNFRKVIGKYAYYFIKTNFIKEVKKQSALTTVDSLRLPMLSNLQITLPPINEQKIIIEYIESELNDYEELISKYQKQIDLMQEYKTSLISKAVTGKIDVREWQPKQIISETV